MNELKQEQTAQKSSELQQSDKLKSSENKATCLVEQLENLPFQLVKSEGEGYCLAMGKYRTEGYMQTKEEALERVEKIDWELIAIHTQLVVDYILEQIKNHTK